MTGAARPAGDLEERCESPFEREVFRRLTARGYRVTPQVGSHGYRIDLVVEGGGDRRLAVECDGDQYHGPERWADDMRRQRILERVGWRFWRCWASSFALDPDACLGDLFATLHRLGIEPIGQDGALTVHTLHKTAPPAGAPSDGLDPAEVPKADAEAGDGAAAPGGGIRIGDRLIVRYLDDNKSAAFTLSRDRDDPSNGVLGAASPLGRELLGLAEEDEVEFETAGQVRRVLIVKTERAAAAP